MSFGNVTRIASARSGANAMNRPISTKTHGMIDYALWVTTASALPKMMTGAARTATLVRNAGTAASINAMVTNYEAGLVRLLPMKGHLAFDFIMCTALVLSPFFLPASERRYALIPMALGAAGLITGLMTQTESPTEYNGSFTPSRDLSEAVADPELTLA
jgi:hypothetical protein